MWHALVFSVFMTSFIKSSDCIECYSCSSKENPDCVNPEKHRLEKVKCDLDALQHTKEFAEGMDGTFSKIFDVHILENAVPLNCLKQVTRVQSEEIIIRGCQLPKDNKLDVCKKVFEIQKKESIDIKHCSLCGTDGCNSGDRVRANWFVLTLVAYFLKQNLI